MVVEQRIPTIPITEIEQSAFCQTDEELRAKTLEEELSAGVRWQKLRSATCACLLRSLMNALPKRERS